MNNRRYWWVSHGKTFKHQVTGNHLWSPKEDKKGKEVHAFVNMTKINSGDIVFSYANQKISYIGIATGGVRSKPRPKEYIKDWNDQGFMVPVTFHKLTRPFDLKTIPGHDFDNLSKLLPAKHSPLRINNKDGKDVLIGNQTYLSKVSEKFSFKLIDIIGRNEFERIISQHLDPEELSAKMEGEAFRDSHDSLIEKIARSIHSGLEGDKHPKKQNTKPPKPRHDRDQKVRAYVYKRAKGYCELCNSKAPFNIDDKNGGERPFLESHHIIWLSNNGEDTVENSVALCPNCHRRMHHNKNTDDVASDVNKLIDLYKFISVEDELTYKKIIKKKK